MPNDTFGSRLKKAWNLFLGRDPTNYQNYGSGSYYRSGRTPIFVRGEGTIASAVYNRIALDVAATDILHVRLDANNRFTNVIESPLNTCLTLEANKDQSGRNFIHDLTRSMLDEGAVAVVPIDTDRDPTKGSFEIFSMRVGKILEWYPDHVKVNVYNDRTGYREDVTVSKSSVAIIENPFYEIMNAPNSTLQRLARKLQLLDAIDEQSGSGKLDLIIQLPYVVKSQARQEQAERRRKEIEEQLNNSKYGIAYTDGTEHITQLNRSVENNLLSQIEYLTNMFFSQLGITTTILDGTANASTFNNYYDRVIEPIVAAISIEYKRKFLTPTARSQHQSIEYFRDPFRLIPVTDIAEIADKFTRNEIMTSNEIRQAIGLKPSDNPEADELRNKNLSKPADALSGLMQTPESANNEQPSEQENGIPQEDSDIVEDLLSSLEGQIDKIIGQAMDGDEDTEEGEEGNTLSQSDIGSNANLGNNDVVNQLLSVLETQMGKVIDEYIDEGG